MHNISQYVGLLFILIIKTFDFIIECLNGTNVIVILKTKKQLIPPVNIFIFEEYFKKLIVK